MQGSIELIAYFATRTISSLLPTERPKRLTPILSAILQRQNLFDLYRTSEMTSRMNHRTSFSFVRDQNWFQYDRAF